jgi:cardiolipin synthase (CMP-forming)
MWKISNLLSLSRLIMTLPLCLAVYYNHTTLIITLSCLAFASDYLDGYLARKLNQISDLGKILDPLADKVMVSSIVILLLFLGRFPLWIGLIIISRDLLILAGGLIIRKKKKLIVPSNLVGKWAVTFIGVYIFGILIYNNIIMYWGPVIVIFFLFYSFITYVFNGWKILKG